MTENTWKDYYEKTKNRKPDQLLVRAVSLVVDKKSALDLGIGTGNDTRYLLNEGFDVTGIDSDPNVKLYLNDIYNQPNFDLVIDAFEDFNFQKYDLINARYSLPFLNPAGFAKIIVQIKNSLNRDGIFVGQFFGEQDEWNNPETEMTFVTKEEAKEILSDMEIIEIVEENKEGKTATGSNKHWHVFHILAKKI